MHVKDGEAIMSSLPGNQNASWDLPYTVCEDQQVIVPEIVGDLCCA